MRPPEFTGGNAAWDEQKAPTATGASMRPPEFTGGNQTILVRLFPDTLTLQ